MIPSDSINGWRAEGIKYAALITNGLLLWFTYRHHAAGNTEMVWVSLAGLPFTTATAWIAHRWKDAAQLAPIPVIMYVLGMIFSVLFVWNDDRGAALMWFSIVPPYAMFAFGSGLGLALSGLALAIWISGMLWADHILTTPYLERALAAYLLVTGFTFALERKREQAMRAVEAANARIDALEGMLKICGWCHKKMLDDKREAWISTEAYFEQRAQVQFSHSMCPECQAKMAKELEHS